jgi:hypothetical protein
MPTLATMRLSQRWGTRVKVIYLVAVFFEVFLYFECSHAA